MTVDELITELCALSAMGHGEKTVFNLEWTSDGDLTQSSVTEVYVHSDDKIFLSTELCD